MDFFQKKNENKFIYYTNISKKQYLNTPKYYISPKQTTAYNPII